MMRYMLQLRRHNGCDVRDYLYIPCNGITESAGPDILIYVIYVLLQQHHIKPISHDINSTRCLTEFYIK